MSQPIPPIWHPYLQHGLNPEIIPIARAEGAWLYSTDGRAILDGISSWWVTLHGHAHPVMAQAIARQAQVLEQVIFSNFTHAPAEELARRLLALAPQFDGQPRLETVFYSDNGSTAVEVALKMAVGYHGHTGRPGASPGAPSGAHSGIQPRQRMVALEHAYHGDTFGAMSVSAQGSFTAPYRGLLFPVERLPFPGATATLSLSEAEAATEAAFARLLDTQGEQIAALIVEPVILGSGGMLTWSPALLARLAALARAHGVLVIADEVMTGFGRTSSGEPGTLWACQQAGIVPDLMCLSKGITGGFMPLGVTLATGAVFNAFRHTERARTFFHGHSYTANPLACAAAVASLGLFETENTLGRIRAIGEQHKTRLARLEGHPQVAALRQAGTIAAVEFRVPDGGYLSDMGPKLARFFLEHGVLLRPLGNVVYVLPPYCITPAELDQIHDLIGQALDLHQTPGAF